MALTDQEIREHLEPEVKGMPMSIATDISRAISMKRIADFICGGPRNSDMVDYLARRVSELRY